jgi:acyl dehydratase
MSRTVVVRYKTSPEAGEENQRRVEAVFAELAATDPDGLRYATFRLADQVTFVHVAMLEGDDNPLTRSVAFAAFQEGLAERCVEPPAPSEATLVGSYRL